MGKSKLFSLTEKDFKIQTFKGSGPGGQHKNKRETAVRITHEKSGAVGQSQEMKSQAQNKELAFKRLIESKKFQSWLKWKAAELSRDTSLEEYVDEQMKPWFIKEETYEPE